MPTKREHSGLPVRLIFRSIWFYRRLNLPVICGVALVSLTLCGALLIGNSLRTSLHRLADTRLGRVRFLVRPPGHDGVFDRRIADSLMQASTLSIAPIVHHRGMASVTGGRLRINRVSIYGVDNGFWKMGPRKITASALTDTEAVINLAVARRLGISQGDEIILRFKHKEALPMDAPFSKDDIAPVQMRLTVRNVIDAEGFGDFSTRAQHGTVHNIFVNLSMFARESGHEDKISALLVAAPAGSSVDSNMIARAIEQCWLPSDGGIHIRRLPCRNTVEFYTDDIFISAELETALMERFPDAWRVFTYFVNSLKMDSGTIPYSFVSTAPDTLAPDSGGILLGPWAAENLKARTGDAVTIRYFVPSVSGRLTEKSAGFTVAGIVPQSLPWADSTLMPHFPGLADAEHCTQWNAGIPIDLDRIRPEDEAYWKQWRGTPKAFIRSDAARHIWNNRFGSSTALRIPVDEGRTIEDIHQQLTELIRNRISSYLAVIPIRKYIERSIDEGIDFAPLFTGLSFFIIAAAVLLTMLLFGVGLHHREAHLRVFTATGFTAGQILRGVMVENIVLAATGTIIGAVCSPLYTAAILFGLRSIWHAAAPLPVFRFTVDAVPLLIGSTLTLIMIIAALWGMARARIRRYFSLKKAVYKTVTILPFHISAAGIILVLSVTATCGLILYALLVDAAYATDVYFGVGACMIVAAMSAFRLVLGRKKSFSPAMRMSLWHLAVTGVRRRLNRATGTAAIIAGTLFIVSTMSLFKHDTTNDPHDRSGPTGGFVWFASLSSPVAADHFDSTWLHDRGCHECGGKQLIVPMRLLTGDDASCLNLNRVSQPQLVGVDASRFDSSARFSFARLLHSNETGHPWRLLKARFDENTIPGFADQNVIEWGLGMKLGDTLTYLDESGTPLAVILVGALANTVFQGQVLIDEAHFTRHFPSEGGYRQFLADAPGEAEKNVAESLRYVFSDQGIEIESTVNRLAVFNSVENTYLDIFSFLGFFGLLFGCTGTGIITIHQALERRREFALFRAQGFTTRRVRQLLRREQMIVFFTGVAAGLVAAFSATVPSGAAAGPAITVPLVLVAVSVMIVGYISIGAAVSYAVGKDPLRILQDE